MTELETAASAIRYSVVIPCFNEADNIRRLIDEIVAACRASDGFEIVVVDDGSTDATPERLRQARHELGSVLRVLRHGANRGQSAALCTGIDAARGHWIVTLDGDGQNDPADIPALLARLPPPGAPIPPLMVCGHRTRRQDTLVRRWSSRLANAVRARVLHDATPDTGCGIKLFPRSLFLRLPRFDHMHRFLPALAQREGGATVSIDVHHRPRLHGRSKYGIGNRLWVGIADLLGVAWLGRRRFEASVDEEL